MKGYVALLLYCVLFSTLFVAFYSLISPDSRFEKTSVQRDYALASVASKTSGKSLWRTSSYKENIPHHRLRKPIHQSCPYVPTPLMEYIADNHSNPLTEREKILAMCKQTKPISLASFFTETMIATLTKLGEGAFADVFGCQKEGWDRLAIKVIPIEGDFKYNDEPQNTFKSIQTEIVVSVELSLLGDESRKKDKRIPHYTKNFMQIERVGLCTGKFPHFLLEAWDDYDFRKKSDNDRPDVFPESQLYIMFSAENSGIQLGSYVYHSFEEFISIFQQISITIGVGEAALQFEHRDMHRGNVLVRRTHEEHVYFRINGKDITIKTYGVLATIVDYTLSRVRQGDSKCTSYTDLNKMPWLFNGKGDIQFDVYRDIRNHTQSQWEKFFPYSNVLWINYLATKCSMKPRLKGISSKTWRKRLQPYIDQIPDNDSAQEVFANVFSPSAVRRISEEASSSSRRSN